MTTRIKASPLRAEDRYLDLVRRLPLRPIRSDEELRAAVSMLDELIDRGGLAPEEDDYMEVLGGLVERFEDERHPLPPVSDAAMLRHLIESRATTQVQVAEGSGIAKSTLSGILSGRRGMNRKHVEALARFFKVSPATFIQID